MPIGSVNRRVGWLGPTERSLAVGNGRCTAFRPEFCSRIGIVKNKPFLSDPYLARSFLALIVSTMVGTAAVRGPATLFKAP